MYAFKSAPLWSEPWDVVITLSLSKYKKTCCVFVKPTGVHVPSSNLYITWHEIYFPKLLPLCVASNSLLTIGR